MTGSELKAIALSIAKGYVESNKDMNEAIREIAKQKRLNDEQVKRLVEEANNATFLLSFQKNGDQVFDVADFTKVRGEIEKKACFLEIPTFSYGEKKPIEKVASAPEESVSDGVFAFLKVAEEIGQLFKITSKLEEEFNRAYGGEHMLKCASADRPLDHLLYVSSIKKMDDLAKVAVKIVEMDKQASLLWGSITPSVSGVINAAARPIKWGAGIAGGALGLGVKGVSSLAGKAAPMAVRALSGGATGAGAAVSAGMGLLNIGAAAKGASALKSAITKPTTFVSKM